LLSPEKRDMLKEKQNYAIDIEYVYVTGFHIEFWLQGKFLSLTFW
jgi:hypothetical protein